MAKTPSVDPATGQPKAKRARTTAMSKPVYVLLQISDESGQPMPFDKNRIKLVGMLRSGEDVLNAIEGGNVPNAFYLRGVVAGGKKEAAAA